jgi:arsenate reductase
MFKVLFLCTENACRSQIAEGLVNHFLAGKVKAFSAGVAPTRLNPRAVQVMGELGIDISQQKAKSVAELPEEGFDLVVTVCDNARETCPFFPGAGRLEHLGFTDPGGATGTEDEILAVFRRVRDEMREKIMPWLAREASEKPGS